MSTRRALERARDGALAIVPVVCAALVPKCPLCVAAALASIGIGLRVAHAVAPWARFVAIALALASVAFVLWRLWRVRSPKPAGCCHSADG